MQLRNKYKKTMGLLIAILVLLLVIFVWLGTVRIGFKHYLTMIVLPVIFIILLFLITYFQKSFIKKGYYNDMQALKFFLACEELNLGRPNRNNYAKCEEQYFLIFGTKEFTGKGNLQSHMVVLYYAGKKIQDEKNEKR